MTTIRVGERIVGAVRPRGNESRFLVSGLVDGVSTKILLDSGASVTVVSRCLLKTPWRVRRVVNTPLRVANNSCLNVVGRKRCEISIGGSSTVLDVYVVEELNSPCILRIDGLKGLGITMKFDKDQSEVSSRDLVVGSVEAPDLGEVVGKERKELLQLIEEYQDLFQPIVPGAAKDVVHRIQTDPHEPFVCRGKRVPLADQMLIEIHVEKMLEDGVISPSESPYRSPVVLASKKDGEKRFCVNFVKLNSVTVKNRHPLPFIDDLLDRTKGSKFFCVLDMSSAYWQVPLAKEDRSKTAFSTTSGHYEFNVMAFGLCNAPASQQESMRRTLKGIPQVDVLLDDVIIHDKSISALLWRLREVFQRLREKNLRLKMKKCHFMKTEVRYLGYILTGEGRKIDPEKTKVIDKFPEPKSVRELKTFLGMTTFCRKFVKDFATMEARRLLTDIC